MMFNLKMKNMQKCMPYMWTLNIKEWELKENY